MRHEAAVEAPQPLEPPDARHRADGGVEHDDVGADAARRCITERTTWYGYVTIVAHTFDTVAAAKSSRPPSASAAAPPPPPPPPPSPPPRQLRPAATPSSART